MAFWSRPRRGSVFPSARASLFLALSRSLPRGREICTGKFVGRRDAMPLLLLFVSAIVFTMLSHKTNQIKYQKYCNVLSWSAFFKKSDYPKSAAKPRSGRCWPGLVLALGLVGLGGLGSTPSRDLFKETEAPNNGRRQWLTNTFFLEDFFKETTNLTHFRINPFWKRNPVLG